GERCSRGHGSLLFSGGGPTGSVWGKAPPESGGARRRRGGMEADERGPRFATRTVGADKRECALSARTPLALGDVDIVRAHVVGRLQPLPPRRHVELQQGRGADGRGHVQVEADRLVDVALAARVLRSEEHTSELQSRENLVCRLLLEKKKYE